MKIRSEFLSGAVSYWNSPMDMEPAQKYINIIYNENVDNRTNRKTEKSRSSSKSFNKGKNSGSA
jgi:hypothetical protein